jgi:ketosteroid isomerase-like protein
VDVTPKRLATGSRDVSLDRFIDQCEEAWRAFVKGDPAPAKALFSRRNDVTLANPWGPPVTGWDRVSPALEAAAARFSEGEIRSFEVAARYVATDLACVFEIERGQAKVGGARQLAPFALRVTSTYRFEDGEWKIVLRHADPITALKPPDAALV